MFKLIFKRITFSLAIIVGVMILTFGLFNVAAGDPAAPLLGKNATPADIEDLRMKIGSNLPIFAGRHIESESFNSIDFLQKTFRYNVSGENYQWGDSANLVLKDGELNFKRNFTGKLPLVLLINFRGSLTINQKTYEHSTFSTQEIPIDDNQSKVSIAGNATINKLNFVYIQNNIFNSQFSKLFSEVISFSSEFPYVKLFDMGNSIITNEPIRKIIWQGMVPSLLLMLPIFFGEMLIGIVLSLIACALKDSFWDKFIIFMSVVMMSISYLVLIIFFQWFFGYYCNFFPVWGYGDIRYLILPICAGIFYGLGSGVRFYRTVFVNELHKEYLRTAEAKGCSKFTIYGKHLLKNAAIPIIAQASATLPFLFTGSLLLETFFGIPGLGSASIDALNNSDLQLLKALVIFSAILFVVLNFISDFIYSLIDVRVKNDN